jgi:hypothetical protein
LTNLPSGGVIEHTERWFLANVDTDESEESINTNILPLVNSFISQCDI